MLFFHKKEIKQKTYNKEECTPVLKRSICTGETVAGFRNKQTGKFCEEMLIINDKDLDSFKKQYGITEELEIIY